MSNASKQKNANNYFEIVYSPKFGVHHDLGYPHPNFESYENPQRCKIPWKYMEERGYVPQPFYSKKQKTLVNDKKKVILKKPRPVNEKDLLRVHTKNHVEKVKHFSKIGGGQIGYTVMATKLAWKMGLLSAGSVYQALRDAVAGKCLASFSFNRPPGHHAVAGESDGLCIFNNVAIAIEKLRAERNFKDKIAVVDIDAHFGDGISKIYYEDPSVMYCSAHEYGFGGAEDGYFGQYGKGEGLGTNINFPVPFESNDSLLRMFCNYVEPFIKKFKPKLIVFPIGFDGHWMDPLGNLHYTLKGFSEFAKWGQKIAKSLGNAKIAFNFEGGYNLLVIAKALEAITCAFTNQMSHRRSEFEEFVLDMYHYKDITKTCHPLFELEFKNAKRDLTKIWNKKKK